ncbi:MAG: hypothetical protein IJH82_05360 [Lachnospiraceae bacterium]|nr:hypothetical protein [Lachnospiraceae bacterium]
MKNELENIDKRIDESTEISEIAEDLLFEIREESIPVERTIKLPISELSALGAGVSSLIPEFNKLTHTMNFDIHGTFELANACRGDVLKVAKNGNFWGAFKTAEGASKFAQLKQASPISIKDTIKMNTNPSMLMMAVALYSMEKEMKKIEETQKQILSFLEKDKEAQVEADIRTLNEIVIKYKSSWDNEHFITSNHKMVCDIQRNARKDVIFYQKDIAEVINKQKKLFVTQGNVNMDLKTLQKKFENYRLCLFAFTFATYLEILLSGNFSEENIKASIKEIQTYSTEYRELFGECSIFLEKKSKKSIESNVLKGIGTTSSAVGKVIGGVPKIKEGHVDDFLRDKGEQIKGSANNISKETIEAFSKVSNPKTREFVVKLEEMILIFNHTENICIDGENVYLITG